MSILFGDKPSPAMASFVMLHIAEKFKSTHPEASWILQHDRYMDNSSNARDNAVLLNSNIIGVSRPIRHWTQVLMANQWGVDSSPGHDVCHVALP